MSFDAHAYSLFDTHAHLDFPPFVDTLPDTINRFYRANIKKVFIPAVQAKAFTRLLSIANQYHDKLQVGLGLHPYFIEAHKPEDLDFLKSCILSDRQSNRSVIKAIGEIGLDAFVANHSKENFQQQLHYFVSQLFIAQEFNLPVVIHSRKMHQEIVKSLKAMFPKIRGVIHGFSGSYEQALDFIKLGFMIGVGGVITYPRANKTRLAVAKIPLDFIVLETDSPDMPPLGQQGVVNRSENLVQIFDVLCSLRTEEKQDIAERIWANSNSLLC